MHDETTGTKDRSNQRSLKLKDLVRAKALAGDTARSEGGQGKANLTEWAFLVNERANRGPHVYAGEDRVARAPLAHYAAPDAASDAAPDAVPALHTSSTIEQNGAEGSNRISSANVDRAAPKDPRARKRPLAESLAELPPPPLPSESKKILLRRLAVDIPDDLHATIKRVARRPGGSVRDDVAALLEWYYLGR